MAKIFFFFSLLFLLIGQYGEKIHPDVISLKKEGIYFDNGNVKLYYPVNSRNTYQQGDIVELIFPIEISKSHYIYWKKSNTIGLPTKLNVKSSTEFLWQKTQFSRPSIYTPNKAGRVLQMRGKIYFLVSFQLTKDIALGKKEFDFSLFYQLCKKDLCFPPKTKKFKLPIIITSKRGTKNQQFIDLLKNFPQRIAIEKIVKKTLGSDNSWNLAIKDKTIDYLFFFNRHKGKKNLFSRQELVREKFNKEDLGSWVAWGEEAYYEQAKENKTLSVKLQKEAKPQKNTGNFENHSLFFYLLTALIGGFILNFMPCVFPVVSLKLLKTIEEAGYSRQTVIKNNLYFALGIISSLLFLVSIILLVKYTSSEFSNITWGAQLQSPYFVYILTMVFSAISLNLFGVFEFGLFLVKLTNKQKNETKLSHYFFNGVLTTVASTPCLAPFFSSAIAFAFNTNYLTTILVFLFIGLGLASPFLLFAFFPFLKSFLPKPGAWLKEVKIFLGFIMSFVVLWLITVLETQLQDSFSYILYMLGLLFLTLWIYGTYTAFHRKRRVRIIALIISLLLIVYIITTSFIAISTERYVQSISNEDKQKFYSEQQQIYWQKFTPKYYEQLKKQGKRIFVSFTASWCLTCKINEQFIFESKEFFDYVNQQKIVCLKADFTDYHKQLAQFLAQYNAHGVPFYLFFSPQQGEVILPNILTNNIIKEKAK